MVLFLSGNKNKALLAGLAFLCLSLIGICIAAGSNEDVYQEKLSKLKDNDVAGNYQLGLWCLQNKMPEKANAHFEKVIQLAPDHANARKQLGYVKYNNQWVKEEEKNQLEYKDKLSQLAEDDADGHYKLGAWCEQKKLWKEAQDEFEKTLKLKPDDANAQKELKKIIPELITQSIAKYISSDETTRNSILEELKPYDEISPDEASKWADIIKKRLAEQPKSEGKPVSVLHHKNYPIKYKLLGKTSGSKLSLFIMLHGGGNADSNTRQWETIAGTWWGSATSSFDIVVIPRVWDDSSLVGWTEKSGIESILALMNEIKRSYNIDTNRIYLGGYSMGGWGTSGITTMAGEDDHFAAVAVVAGGFSKSPAVFDNLLNTPMTIHIGDQDTQYDRLASSRFSNETLTALHEKNKDGYKFAYKEYPGAGHQLPTSAATDANKWLIQYTRNPFPPRLVWVISSNPAKRYFYWVKIDRPAAGMKIEAKADKNKFVVTTQRVGKFTIRSEEPSCRERV
jgi:predicted esterase